MDAAKPSPAGVPGTRQTAAGRRWLFRVLAGLIIPLLVLGMLELALRFGGYGYPTAFFKPLHIGAEEFLVENDYFGFRFFPPDIARTPATLRMPAKKPPGVYRIFIFGESAALGDPEPAFGAGRYLEVLLRERFPGTQFEVINVAMTAIDSHVILPIARDCARRDGDLWIVYMGNNEMVGPFGAATVFGAQAPPWQLVRLNLAIQKLRLGQLLAEAGRRLNRADSNQASWSGMNAFAGNLVGPDDPRKPAVYENFKRNLRDILQTGLNSGAPVVLSTVAVNLKDCPPFESRIRGNLSNGDRKQVELLLAQGNSLLAQGNCAAAGTSCEQAARFDPQSADLEFCWGRSLLQATNLPEARVHFQKALDLDCLPFRADTCINSLIADAGREMASPKLTFFDAARALSAGAADEIPGRELFYEHVHLNFAGNYLLARGWAEQVARLLPPGMGNGTNGSWASEQICERRLGLTDWDRYNILGEVCRRLQQPPLDRQLDNARRLQSYLDEKAALQKRMDIEDRQRVRATYVGALSANADDYYLRENFAYFLAETDDVAGAIDQWNKVRALIPQDHVAYFELGRLDGRLGRYEEAKSLLGTAVAIHPSFAPGWFELGKAHAASGDYQQAVRAFNQSLKFDPRNAECWFCSGLALAMLGQRDIAIEHYRQAAKFGPEDWRPHFELGGLLGQDGKMAEAKAESESAVRLNPNFPTAHLNLGLALVQIGELTEAEQQFKETLRLDPTNSKAADCLAQVRALKIKAR